MTPTPGRIVHYVLPKEFRRAGEVRPAIITRILASSSTGLEPAEPPRCQLTVFLDGANEDASHLDAKNLRGLIFVSGALQDAEQKPGTWHEPVRQ
jgi:hypothetical protein